MINKLSHLVLVLWIGISSAQTCPSVTSPLANATNVSVTTLVSWTAVENAVGYYVLIGTTPGGRDLVDRVDVGNNTKFILPEGSAYPANTVISVKITVRFSDRPDQTCPYVLFTTGNAESQQGCGHFINPVADFYACDMDGNNMEEFNIDLIALEAKLIGNQTGLTISYHDADGNAIDLSVGNLVVTNERIILARATNTTACSEETSFKLIVTDFPKAVVFQDIAECERFVLPELNGSGKYFTNPDGGGMALFEGDTITQTQTIYIYTELGDCSDQSTFELTIDPTICEEEESVCANAFPKFFTPNNDGFYDRFELHSNDCPINGVVYIYDRYGKFLKQFDASSGFWDGRYNGVPLLATNYWYKYVESESGKITTGHFLLKR